MTAQTGTISLADVRVGCELFERTPELVDYYPRGGIVLDVLTTWPGGDYWGSPASHPVSFRTVRWDRGQVKYFTLDADVVDPDSVTLPNSRHIRGLCRNICALMAKRKGTDDRADARLAEIVFRLWKVIGT